MPLTAGDFTPSQLLTAMQTADQMWGDEMMKADFEANVDIVNALRKEQNANVTLLEQPEKDRDITVHWVNMCGESAEDADNDDCDLSGAELGSDSKNYALSVEKQFKFTVDEMTFRANHYNLEQVIAKGLLKADKAICEAIAATAIARVESFKGVNSVTDGIGTVNGATTETDIAAADWNERAFAYFYRIAIQNQLANPFLLSGTNLFEDRLVTLLAESNANGKGDANLFKLMRTYFDLFNIDTANTPNLKTYMINRGSIAFASKVYYGRTPTQYIGAGQQRWSFASRNLSGFDMDVYYTNRCTANTIKHDFKVKAKYDWFLNPTGCEGTRTGVLAFNRI